MKVIATQGKTVWLLLVRPKVGRVLDLERNKLFPEFNLDSIIARGYWEKASMSDKKLKELLKGVVDLPTPEQDS